MRNSIERAGSESDSDMAFKPSGVSRVQFAYQPGGPYPSHCGYCHGANDSFIVEGIWAEDMTVQDFQKLVDRGCQRSGKFVYLPSNKITCCPQYVMRLDSSLFRISKQQKRVIRRFKEYLKTGDISGMPNEENTSSMLENKTDVECVDNDFNTVSGSQSRSRVADDDTPKEKLKRDVKPGSGADPKLPPCRKAKLIRKEKKVEKKLTGHRDDDSIVRTTSPSPVPMETQLLRKQRTDVSLEIALPDQDNWKHRFTVKLVCVHPKSEEYLTTFDQSYEVFRKFQMIIHKEPEDKCKKTHFEQFCVDTPLIRESSNIPGVNYGSYHQQYWIDDTLVMVGVLDFLPQGVLCNYLYYDPYYRFLAPGVFSALYEIAQTQDYNNIDSQMRYYYMGYYVHDCPKMNYKRFYDASYVLCPETYQYIPLPNCKPKLDVSKYSRLADSEENSQTKDLEEIGKSLEERDDIGQVLVVDYITRETTRYNEFATKIEGPRFDDMIQQYTKVVGIKLASRMLLYFTGLVPPI